MKNLTTILTLLFISILTLPGAVAQSQEVTSRRQMLINRNDSVIKIYILSTRPGKVKVDEEKMYYWYGNNRIMVNRGAFDGRLIDGPYNVYSVSGQLLERGQITKGLKTGKWITWYHNGEMATKIYWKNGLRDGRSYFYDQGGDLVKTEEFSEGKMKGDPVLYKDGKKVKPKKDKQTKEEKEKAKKDNKNIDEPQVEGIESEKEKKGLFHFLKSREQEEETPEQESPKPKKKKEKKDKESKSDQSNKDEDKASFWQRIYPFGGDKSAKEQASE